MGLAAIRGAMRTGEIGGSKKMTSAIRFEGVDDGYEAELLQTISRLERSGKSNFPKSFKDIALPKFKDVLDGTGMTKPTKQNSKSQS